ncbi:MAG: hypothetical protein ACTH32_06640 [Microbacterium gubbeenense]|uniref:hypothetical protein n=1 Tax=Microbacterium gubbeenense TaxID=159896 RepID=UPI003F973926
MPSPEDRLSALSPTAIDHARVDAIHHARDHGLTWQQISDHLSMTRTGVRKLLTRLEDPLP